MQLSARNQLNATVETVTHGEVMSTVKVDAARRSARHRRHHQGRRRGPRLRARRRRRRRDQVDRGDAGQELGGRPGRRC